MSESIYTILATLHNKDEQIVAAIDIDPLNVQYAFSSFVILVLNLIALYQFSLQMWAIYQQNDMENIIHDIYDKTILHMSIKYVIVNIICLFYFDSLTSLPVLLIKVFWLYCLVIVFMKFDVKEILWPSILFAIVLVLISVFYVCIFDVLPLYKLILVQSLVIIYFGANQAYRVTKILNSFNKQKKKKTQLSVETLLDKNNVQFKNTDFQIEMNLQLDEHILGHLQNRRSFSIVFTITLFVDLILYLNLEAGKELLGQVFLSVVLDLLPLYIVFWYLRASGKEQKQNNKRFSRRNSEYFQQQRSTRGSKICIEMVNLKN